MDSPLPPPADPRGALWDWFTKWLTPEEPAEGWRGWPARCVAFLRSIPAATWLALLLFLVMLVAALVVWSRFRSGVAHRPWDFRLDWQWIVAAILLVLVVPLLLYRVATSWRDRPSSPFAAIDAEWQRGLAVLRREGVSPRATPLFLLLGTLPVRHERGLIEASGLDVRAVGETGEHLAWYVGREAIYVALRSPGVTGEFERLGAAVSSATRLAGGLDGEIETTGTSSAADLQHVKSRHRALVHVARRLVAMRLPSCACNGILVVVPFGWLHDCPSEDDRLARAIRSDLLSLQRTTGVRAPVTLLVEGADRHPGFAVLVRRVGRERALQQRFGHRYPPSAEAFSDDVARLAEHACGAFEDWIHVLFREQHVLTREGNGPLYALLSNVRLRLTGRLRRLLREGIGYDPDLEPAEDGVPFSGCYFCGIEPDGEHWAFAKGVFGKQVEEQGLVEWSAATARMNRRRRRWWWTAIVLNVLLAGSLLAMFIRRPSSVGWTSNPPVSGHHGSRPVDSVCVRVAVVPTASGR